MSNIDSEIIANIEKMTNTVDLGDVLGLKHESLNPIPTQPLKVYADGLTDEKFCKAIASYLHQPKELKVQFVCSSERYNALLRYLDIDPREKDVKDRMNSEILRRFSENQKTEL